MVYGLYLVAYSFAPSTWDLSPDFLKAAACFLIFGLFVGVVAVTDSEHKSKAPSTWLRVCLGALSGAFIAAVLAPSVESIALGLLVGVMLGYAGILWVKHLP